MVTGGPVDGSRVLGAIDGNQSMTQLMKYDQTGILTPLLQCLPAKMLEHICHTRCIMIYVQYNHPDALAPLNHFNGVYLVFVVWV